MDDEEPKEPILNNTGAQMEWVPTAKALEIIRSLDQMKVRAFEFFTAAGQWTYCALDPVRHHFRHLFAPGTPSLSLCIRQEDLSAVVRVISGCSAIRSDILVTVCILLHLISLLMAGQM